MNNETVFSVNLDDHGLEAGEVVVVEGTQKALPGEAVRIIERVPPTEETRAAERSP